MARSATGVSASSSILGVASVKAYRAAFELSASALALIGADGKLIDANPAFCAIAGRTQDDIVGSVPGWLETDDGGQATLVAADGSKHPVRLTRSPLADGGAVVCLSDLEPACLKAVVRTEPTAMQQRSGENERRLRAIIENTFEFIGLLDTNGHMLEANRTSLSFIGLKNVEPLVGRHFAETPWWEHSPDDRQILHRGIESAANGEFVRFETTHMDAEGGIAYMDFSLRPVRDENGTVVFLIPEGRDITRRKHTEAALVSAKLEAEAANRAKSEFLATVSHELRTPLNAVVGFSEALLADAFGPIDGKRSREYVKLIHSAGVHLRSVIDDILDVSLVDIGRIELDEEETDLAALIAGVVRLVGHRAEAGKVNLSLALPDNLPHLMADQRRLRQIVLNLVSNALKFTPDEGTVTISAQECNDGVEIVVADTGTGIPPEHLSKVWQPFFQSEPTLTRSHGGSGLGLPIVKHFVEAHGGWVGLDSVVGLGTRARVLLPRRRILRAMQ
jgi:two-component system, cell cycle sensor histidine kinase DivJ